MATESFNNWLAGAPVVDIDSSGSFENWLAGAPVVDGAGSPSGVLGVVFFQGRTTLTADLEQPPPPPPLPPPIAPGIVPPAFHIPCVNKLNECLPCNDDPVLNISAEDADSDRFLFNFNLRQRPNLGFRFEGVGCKRFCYSTVSQLDADLCAILQTVECINAGFFVPPTMDGNQVDFPTNPALFFNMAQFCSTMCPDGSSFGVTVQAGQVRDRNQVQANRIARSLACKLATKQRICIAQLNPDETCFASMQSYQATLKAKGGQPIEVAFWNIGLLPIACNVSIGDIVPYLWSIVSGGLPHGLTLEPCTGIIRGEPDESGSFPIRIRATDAIGSFQERSFTLRVIEIYTDADLPEGGIGTPYLEHINAAPGGLDEQVWSIVFGSLPPGLSMTTAGVVNGTPTASGSFSFTAQVKVGSATCSKTFTLVIGHDYGNITPDIFSATLSFWNGGMTLPAGNYRVTYVTGAMMYAPCVPPCWNVNTVGAGFHVKYNAGGADVLFPAATTGRLTQPEVYVDNAGKFIDIVHGGGTIGMMLVDAPYGDNVAGSPTPTFNLARL